VFFALIGGLAAFGGIGLLVGPLAVSMFLALLTIYHRDFSPQKRGIPPVPGVPGSPPQPPAEGADSSPQT
jgi:predicted PurR-regulated permease PerM